MRLKIVLAAAVALAPLTAAVGQAVRESVVNPAYGVPVFAGDITDRRYVVLGEVHAGVRKATLFSNAVSEAKIYRELWERGRKMGADAIIKVRYGKSHVTAMSWGKTNATGTAIKFTSQAATTN